MGTSRSDGNKQGRKGSFQEGLGSQQNGGTVPVSTGASRLPPPANSAGGLRAPMGPSQSCAGEGRKGNAGAKSCLVIVASTSSEAVARKEVRIVPGRPPPPSQVTVLSNQRHASHREHVPAFDLLKAEPVSSASATSLQRAPALRQTATQNTSGQQAASAGQRTPVSRHS